jgi:hypothetical protein
MALKGHPIIDAAGPNRRLRFHFLTRIKCTTMPYTMKLKYDGKEIPLSKYETVDFYKLKDQFTILDTKMSSDYEITVGRIGSAHPPFTRSEFREILRTAGGLHTGIIEHFFHEDDFDAFVSQKRVVSLDEVAGNAYYKDMEQFQHIRYVILYPSGYYILEIFQAGNHTTQTTDSYAWPVPMDRPAEQSDSLEELERMMYMTYLGDAIPRTEEL